MATGFPKNLQDRLCVLPLHDGVLFEFFFKLCNALQIFFVAWRTSRNHNA